METPARLTVDLTALREGEPARLRGALDAAALGVDDLEWVRPAGPLAYDAEATLLPGDVLEVRGRLRLPCACVCGRCGRDFRAEYAEEGWREDFDVAGQTSLDLTESAREGIILALPSYPVCDEGCKGVCPRCGRNLNEGPCGCATAGEDSPWGALDGLTAQTAETAEERK